ncbi:MAG: histidine kinase, partial [Geobacter sp.]|nr:histidine kinase [Geobacter sp.]
MNSSREAINYVVGQELSLLELLQTFDIKGLLRGALEGGAVEAAILLADGSVICSVGKQPGGAELREIRQQLLLEGEPAGYLLVRGGQGDSSLEGIAAMLKMTVDMVITNNLKRMLTAQMHSSLVTKTYDELLSKNLALSASEARYRELAESLEVKVAERTKELAAAQVKLLQQEKLASIGQLAAGVAHEINNPIGFINSNLVTMKKYVARLLEMLDWLESQVGAGSADAAGVEEKKRSLKIGIVTEDVWDLLDQSLAGAERVRKIVADLKGVSHVDETGVKSFNIRHEVEQTLAVIKNLLPPDAEVNTAFSETPPVAGSGALFCQALEN